MPTAPIPSPPFSRYKSLLSGSPLEASYGYALLHLLRVLPRVIAATWMETRTPTAAAANECPRTNQFALSHASGNAVMRYSRAIIFAILSTGSAAADPMIFMGRVEASEHAVLSSRLNGVVTEILFEGGDLVAAGQPLIRLDPTDAEIALEIAAARLAEARALLEGATRRTARQEALHVRGITADASLGPARTEKAMAKAAVALAMAEQRRAALDLERAIISAPISGLISPPAVAVGAFLEAEAGPPLGRIVAFDPAIVAYRTPYSERLAALEATSATTAAHLLQHVRVRLQLPGGRVYPGEAIPHAESAEVDAETDTVTVWARFPNPDALLRPGMSVTVLSTVGSTETEE
ncbi:RND family efflux transporter MFP subunit [Roseovarius sp. MBR-51]